MTATLIMAKENTTTQDLTFTGDFKGSSTWITKWGRFEFAEDDLIRLHPEPHCQGQVPYEGKITTTSDDVAHVTVDNVWGIPTGLYSLEYVPDMMPAEWFKGALEFSPQPEHTLQMLASGSNNKPLNPISEDIIQAVAADLKLEPSQCFALQTAMRSQVWASQLLTCSPTNALQHINSCSFRVLQPLLYPVK